MQLDELLKAYKVLDKAGADDSLLKIVIRELTDRGVDIATETGQELLQETTTIAGAQLGSKLDTGEWAYNFGDVTDRLRNTAKESALTFGLTNIPSTVYNIDTQNRNRMTKLATQGEARLRAGEMPTPTQLEAMNLSESEARGKMVMLNLDKFDDSDASQTGERTNRVLDLESVRSKPYATSRPNYGKNQVEMVWENAKDPVFGKVYDPSGVEIPWDRTKARNGQWDMGHIPGEKYSKKHQLYMDDVISKEDFLAWYRNPANYRPELPHTNRGHKYE